MKDNGVFPVLVLIAGVLLHFNYGLSQPLNFTLEKENVISWEWRVTKRVYHKDVIRLTCTAATPSQLLIRRENDSFPLVTSNGTTVTYKFSKILCKDMDRYICEYKQGQNVEKATRDLGIDDCPPRPCNEDTTLRILYAELGETKILSLCVMVYPDISKYAYFNSTRVLGNTPLSDGDWTWFFERKRFNKFTINITVRNITSHGETTFRISTLVHDKFLLNYTLDLREPGPPECPMNVTAQSGSQDIQLTWVPGLDRGASQSFQIYLRDKESGRWEPYGEPVRETSLNVIDLEQNTTLYFRVIAFNKYSIKSSNSPDHCNNTAVGTTANFARAASSTTPLSSLSEPSNGTPQSQNDSGESSCHNVVPIVVTIGIVGFILIVAVIIGICVYRRLIRQSKRNGATKNSSQQLEDDEEVATPLTSLNQLPVGTVPEESGPYKPPDGLRYVTCAHKPNTGTSQPNQAKR